MPYAQKDLFSCQTAPGESPVVLHIKGIPAPRTLKQLKHLKPGQPAPAANCHIPSFKNAKHWVTRLPNGKPLKRPLLITSPEFQEWMKKASQSLLSQLLSMCQTGSDGIQSGRSKLFVMCSRLPADDSGTWLPVGSWKVVHVPPGQEGCEITITRLR